LIATLALFRDKREESMIEKSHLAKNEFYREKFLAAIDDDLDTPTALTVMGEINKSNLRPAEKYDLVVELDRILGLNLPVQVEKYLERNRTEEALAPEGEAELVLQMREDARANKDYARADYLRERLEGLGYKIIDTKQGAKIKKINAGN
jgi:cysteinyl-tRNA synthetase